MTFTPPEIGPGDRPRSSWYHSLCGLTSCAPSWAEPLDPGPCLRPAALPGLVLRRDPGGLWLRRRLNSLSNCPCREVRVSSLPGLGLVMLSATGDSCCRALACSRRRRSAEADGDDRGRVRGGESELFREYFARTLRTSASSFPAYLLRKASERSAGGPAAQPPERAWRRPAHLRLRCQRCLHSAALYLSSKSWILASLSGWW